MVRTLTFCLSLLALAGATSGCSLIYKLPTRQGNVIEQKQLDQLKLGMTPDQVKFLLGTPIAASPYDPNRWDYFGYYKSPRGKIARRTVTLEFNQGRLSDMQGVQLASNDKLLDTPDVETLTKQENKDRTDKSRAESEAGKDTGINIPTPGP